MESQTEGRLHPRARTGISDAELVARLRRHDPLAEDLVTSQLRTMLERVAEALQPAEARDDLSTSVLYEILQAEERVLAGWDESAPFLAYLAVVGARVCLDEDRRWEHIRDQASPPTGDSPGAHPTDLMLATHVAGQADEQLGGQVLHHLGRCDRCQWIASAARSALTH
jgi:hypothetical protein